MKKLLLLVMAFLLGAGINPHYGRDGYFFRKKEFFLPTMEVTLMPHKSQHSFDQAALREHIKTPSKKELKAFALVDTKHRKCTIHLIDPDLRYQPEYLGHEIAHCFYGRWHD